MSGSHYPKSLNYECESGSLFVDGHHTTEEIWNYLYSLGVSPTDAVRQIYISNIIKSLEHIDFGAFVKLEKVVFGEGIRSIPERMFDRYYATERNKDLLGNKQAFSCLKTIECQKVEEIGRYAFWLNPVKTVIIGNNCRVLPNAFLDCSNLSKVQLGLNCVLSRYIFSGCPVDRLVVPSGCQVNLNAFTNMPNLKKLRMADNVLVNGPVLDKNKFVEVIKYNERGEIVDKVAKVDNQGLYSMFYAYKDGQFVKNGALPCGEMVSHR